MEGLATGGSLKHWVFAGRSLAPCPQRVKPRTSDDGDETQQNHAEPTLAVHYS